MAEQDKAQREAQKYDGKVGHWVTTRHGKRIFVEMKDYQKWLLGGSLGILGVALSVLVGKKVGFITPKTATALNPVSYLKIARDVWKGRQVLATVIRNNTHPGLPGFSASLSGFSPQGEGAYLVKQHFKMGPEHLGDFEVLLDTKKKVGVIKNLTVNGFDNYRDGLGKMMRSWYDTAEELKLKGFTMKVKRGEQGFLWPLRLGTTWENADVEAVVKDQAVDNFNKFISNLPEAERNAWPAARIVKRIRTARHPGEIVVGPDEWGLGSHLGREYFQKVGPYIMSNVDDWNGLIDMSNEFPVSRATFARFVGYGNPDLNPATKTYLNKFSNFFFKEVEPYSGIEMTNKKGGTYILPTEKLGQSYVAHRIEKQKAESVEKLVKGLRTRGVDVQYERARQTLTDLNIAMEKAKARITPNQGTGIGGAARPKNEQIAHFFDQQEVNKASEQVLVINEAGEQIPQTSLKTKRIQQTAEGKAAFIQGRLRWAMVKNFARRELQARNEPAGEFEVNKYARELINAMDEEDVKRFMKKREVIKVRESGTLLINSKTGEAHPLAWYKDKYTRPRMYVHVEKPNYWFRIEQSMQGYKHPVTGRLQMMPVFRIAPFNKRSIQAHLYQENPLPPPEERAFYSDSEALNYLANWVQTSKHFPEYSSDYVLSGVERMLITTPRKQLTFALQPVTDVEGKRMKSPVNAGWMIESIGSDEKNPYDIKKVFSTREAAEKWLKELVEKAQL